MFLKIQFHRNVRKWFQTPVAVQYAVEVMLEFVAAIPSKMLGNVPLGPN